jgi:acyl carrier protein
MLEPRLTQTISELFGIPAEQVGPETGRDTLPDWDSIGHLKLILEVERAFGIRFPTAELGELTSGAKLQEAIDRIRTAS